MNIAKIRIGELFEVEGKLYIIGEPKTTEQVRICNDHGHIVSTIFEIDTL